MREHYSGDGILLSGPQPGPLAVVIVHVLAGSVEHCHRGGLGGGSPLLPHHHLGRGRSRCRKEFRRWSRRWRGGEFWFGTVEDLHTAHVSRQLGGRVRLLGPVLVMFLLIRS